MCGIIGVASRASVDTSWLATARDAMHHRGPDDFGEWWSSDKTVGLGHRRLSIVDLTSQGHQPMLDEFSNIAIVFNGEIYNHDELRDELVKAGCKFKSSSDTEVVMNAYLVWGLNFLSRLNGMFAIGLYDQRSKKLLLARDRVGEKPLYYSIKQSKIIFSSELKGILKSPSSTYKIKYDGVNEYLLNGFIAGSDSIFEEVNKLPPGEALIYEIESGISNSFKYWELPFYDKGKENKIVSERELISELDYLLEDSVRLQMVADVPVGILLSGGVDSSLIVGMAARTQSNIKTFTVRFPGHELHDETTHARLVARHFGTDHVELEASAVGVDILSKLAKQFDEPIIDSSMIPTYLVSRLTREYCTVALGGDGGDELFGGYRHYNRLIRLRLLSQFVPLSLRTLLSKAASAYLPVGFKGRNWLQAFGCDMQKEMPIIATYFDSLSRKRLLEKSILEFMPLENKQKSRVPDGIDLIDRATRYDFANYLSEDILVKVDRASMLNSLEIRAPFLDYRIVNFAFSKVPTRLKTTKNNRKILLKKLSENILPAHFDRNRKQGFSIPLNSWLKSGEWLEYFQHVLFDKSQIIFNKKMINELFVGQARGNSNGERLFALVMFELWRREYGAII